MSIKTRKYVVFKDGDAWCAIYEDFTNLQESPAGFGVNPDMAILDLLTGNQMEAYDGPRS